MPLIVHIHGGPQVRGYSGIQWGRPDAQFLASRGYVVLEPDPRASTGYGKSHVVSGYKQWGLTGIGFTLRGGATQLEEAQNCAIICVALSPNW